MSSCWVSWAVICFLKVFKACALPKPKHPRNRKSANRPIPDFSNRSVDFVLALLLLIGSTFGAQIGARLSTKLKDDQLKIFLSILVLAVMVKMLFSLVLPPHNLLSYHGGH